MKSAKQLPVEKRLKGLMAGLEAEANFLETRGFKQYEQLDCAYELVEAVLDDIEALREGPDAYVAAPGSRVRAIPF